MMMPEEMDQDDGVIEDTDFLEPGRPELFDMEREDMDRFKGPSDEDMDDLYGDLCELCDKPDCDGDCWMEDDDLDDLLDEFDDDEFEDDLEYMDPDDLDEFEDEDDDFYEEDDDDGDYL